MKTVLKADNRNQKKKPLKNLFGFSKHFLKMYLMYYLLFHKNI